MSKTFKLHAFWHYDKFPNLLGGEVVRFLGNKDHLVETVQYGKGYYFEYNFLVPENKGKLLRDELEKLEAEYDAELKQLGTKFQTKRDNLLKNHGVPPIK